MPTSAITGEGIPDLMLMLVKLTQKFMAKKLLVDKNDVEATVLELKVLHTGSHCDGRGWDDVICCDV